jgi:hypothetical protein
MKHVSLTDYWCRFIGKTSSKIVNHEVLSCLFLDEVRTKVNFFCAFYTSDPFGKKEIGIPD